MTARSSGLILATACLALVAPAVASADVSSLDAYAGQAAVLGKPHHRHHHGHSTATMHGGASHQGAALAGKPSGPTSSSRSPVAGHGSSAAGANIAGTPSGTRPGGSAPSATSAPAGGSGSGASASAGGSGPGASAQNARGGGESGIARGVRNAVPAAASSSSLTSLDIVVLCAATLTLLGTALAVRRLSRQPR